MIDLYPPASRSSEFFWTSVAAAFFLVMSAGWSYGLVRGFLSGKPPGFVLFILGACAIATGYFGVRLVAAAWPLTTASPRLTVSDPKPKRGATIDVELSYPTTPWGIRQVDLVLECVEVTVVTVGTSTTFYRRVIVREVLLTEPVLRDLQSPWRGSVTIPTEYPPHTDVSSNTEDSSPAGGTIVWYLATEAEPSWGRMVTDEFRLHVRS